VPYEIFLSCMPCNINNISVWLVMMPIWNIFWSCLLKFSVSRTLKDKLQVILFRKITGDHRLQSVSTQQPLCFYEKKNGREPECISWSAHGILHHGSPLRGGLVRVAAMVSTGWIIHAHYPFNYFAPPHIFASGKTQAWPKWTSDSCISII